MARDPAARNRAALGLVGLPALTALLLIGHALAGRRPTALPGLTVGKVSHRVSYRTVVPEAHGPHLKSAPGRSVHQTHASSTHKGSGTSATGRTPPGFAGPLTPIGSASSGSASSGSLRPPSLSAAQSVVDQALSDLSGHVHHLPLAGPTVLPPEPPSHTYLTAETSVGKDRWLVRVYKTDAPYAVDNPAIRSPASDPVPVASFGVLRPLRIPHDTAGMTTFLWDESLLATGRSIRDGGPLLPPAKAHGEAIDLGFGVQGILLAVSDETVSLVWHEGDWTLIVRDTTPQTAVAIARPLVAYLHKSYMPPHPGLVVVGIGVDGIETRIAWADGSFVNHIENQLLWGDNPTAACAMAVHWHGA